jgi:hypothetical protein
MRDYTQESRWGTQHDGATPRGDPTPSIGRSGLREIFARAPRLL